MNGRVRRGILEAICEKHGTKPYALMEPRHVTQILDEKFNLPGAANNRLKALRHLFDWAISQKYSDKNPAREVRYLATSSEGIYTWTVEEVREYEACHPIGTKARLAMDLLLLTGVRKSHVVRLGRQFEKNERLNFVEVKDHIRKPKRRSIPILPSLRISIDACPSDHETYLVTAFGQSFTVNGFGNWFRKRCDEAGLPHCSAHGLRKAGATIAAVRGATANELMAIFGWKSLKQAELYTRKASERLLIDGAMYKVEPERKSNISGPPLGEQVAHRRKRA